jgi:carbon monoxide dehydrogenase subunit G
MIKLDFTQEIKSPLEKVFAFVTDFRNAVRWQNGVIESSQTPDGPTGLGTKIKTTRTFLGQRLEATAEVTEFAANQKLAFKSTSGPIQFHFTQTFSSMTGGTKVEIHAEMEAGGFFKLAEGALAGNLKKELEAQGQKLKEVLEAM